MSTKISTYKIKLQTNKNELEYIAKQMGKSTDEVEKLRTYTGVDLDASGKLPTVASRAMEKVQADLQKLVKATSLSSELKALLSTAIEMQCDDFVDNVCGRKWQNSAQEKITGLVRLPKAQPVSVPKDVETTTEL